MVKIIHIVLVLFLMQSCNFFKKDERLLSTHKRINGEKIEIYYVSLGATTNDVVQVRRLGLNTPLWASDKYNYLKSSKLISDTTLQLVVSDTGFHNYNSKVDTILVNIK